MSYDAERVEKVLIDIIDNSEVETYNEDTDDFEYDSAIGEASSFEANGILTMNRGLVLRMSDGAEFQITIVQSR